MQEHVQPQEMIQRFFLDHLSCSLHPEVGVGQELHELHHSMNFHIPLWPTIHYE
jgi:hypothetical protein